MRILPRSWINNIAITVDVLGCSIEASVEEQTEAIYYNTQTPDTLISGITSSLNVNPTDESKFDMEQMKSTITDSMYKLKQDPSSSNLNLVNMEVLVDQLNSLTEDKKNEEQFLVITAQIGKEKQKLMDKLQEDYVGGIIDQTTYQKLKKNLDRFSIADIDLDESMKSNLILQKLKEELDDGVFNFMKDDFESMNLLVSSLKTADSIQKAEILKEIKQKKQQIYSILQQLEIAGKLTSVSLTHCKSILNEMTSLGSSGDKVISNVDVGKSTTRAPTRQTTRKLYVSSGPSEMALSKDLFSINVIQIVHTYF